MNERRTIGTKVEEPAFLKDQGQKMNDPLSVLLRGLISVYRVLISPVLPAYKCRFLPTCSSYALQAIDVHGPIKGSFLAARRLLRCHPWGGSGYDPVPPLKTGERRF